MDPTKWIIREVRIQHDGDATIVHQAFRAFGVTRDMDDNSGLYTFDRDGIAFWMKLIRNPPPIIVPGDPPGMCGEERILEDHLRDGWSLRLQTYAIPHTFVIVLLEHSQIRVWFSPDMLSLQTASVTQMQWRALFAGFLQEILRSCDVPHLLERAFTDAQDTNDAENAFTDANVTIFLD